MKISVVIPVYNAAPFVERAVESALQQPETSEVVLCEDGSPDDSYEVCQGLARKHDRVQLYAHPNHENRGPGATRNRAIRESTHDIIAFLDADDFFLPDRFSHVADILNSQPDADGVYDAVDAHFYSKEEEQKWKAKERTELITMSERVPPDQLFREHSPVGSKGFTQPSGWTIRKCAFRKAGLFNPDLRLHQDTDLFMRFAISCRMVPGKLREPVARRGVHERNRISAPRSDAETFDHRMRMWGATWSWVLKNEKKQEAKVIGNRFCRHFFWGVLSDKDIKLKTRYKITSEYYPYEKSNLKLIASLVLVAVSIVEGKITE